MLLHFTLCLILFNQFFENDKVRFVEANALNENENGVIVRKVHFDTDLDHLVVSKSSPGNVSYSKNN